jgi:Na+/proline symporter
MGIGFFGGGISFLISGAFFVPVFYKLQFISVYEYLEIRYDSVILRRIGSALFLVSTLFYMAVVMYAPSVALVGVTDVPLWPFILAVGAVSTIYTAIGGIKAVIWTDTLQAGFMYVGLGTLIIKGTMDAGGFWKVIEVAEKTGRLTESINKWDPSIFQYNSFWITTFGGILHWTCFYGLNQMALQRYCSMPSLRHARIVMGLTVPAFWIIGIMCCSIGIIMIGYFHGCDPVGTGEIENMDQMSILMAGRILGILIYYL